MKAYRDQAHSLFNELVLQNSLNLKLKKCQKLNTKEVAKLTQHTDKYS